VRIVRVTITPFRLPLRAPLETAHERIDVRRGWLVELQEEGGLRGFGEASPLLGFGMESPAACVLRLSELARFLTGRGAASLDALLDECTERALGAPATLSAIDGALHDLAARGRGTSIAALLAAGEGRALETSLAVNCLIAEASTEALAEAAAARLAEGYACFKLKLGRLGLDEDLARAAALRAAIGGARALRVDANAAWSEAEAQSALPALARLGVEYVEQPLAAADIAGMARLRAAGLAPIAADEAACSESAARAVLAAEAADWLILKPGACGGLRAAWRIAGAAKQRGVGVVVTTLLESAIGTAAAWQLAAALAPDRPADGLATSGLFAADLASLPAPEHGRVALPAGPGLGVTPDPAALAHLSCGERMEIAA
jgi:o-succinylbenzoate synthase